MPKQMTIQGLMIDPVSRMPIVILKDDTKETVMPIWVGVFIRGRFRFVHNQAGARNLTAFHGLYPVRNDTKSHKALLSYLTSDAAQDAIAAQSRLYGGGLRKMEPRDVLAIPIPTSLRDLLSDH